MAVDSPEPDLVAPFVRASESVFRTMLSIACQPGARQPVAASTPLGEFSACVDLTGGVIGAVTFHTHQPTAVQIVERMTGMPAEEGDELILDCVREIANMIGGHGKRELEILQLNLGLPQLEVRPSQRTRSFREHVWIPLESDLGWCGIDVGFHPEN